MVLQPLSLEDLYKQCDERLLPFATTAEIEPVAELIGQPRAMQAIEFATAIERDGFNLFVIGAAGGGQTDAVLSLLREKAQNEKAPSDWVYVHNFDVPHRPALLELPAGQGRRLKKAAAAAVSDMTSAVPATLESDDYQNRQQAIDQETSQRQEQSFEALRHKAESQAIALIRTPQGFAMAPVSDGEVMKPEVFNALPEAQRKDIESKIQALQKELAGILEQLPVWEKERRERLRALNEDYAQGIVTRSFAGLRQAFSSEPSVLTWLDALTRDFISNIHLFTGQAVQQPGALPPEQSLQGVLAGLHGASGGQDSAQNVLKRYETNVLVSNYEQSDPITEGEDSSAQKGPHDPDGQKAAPAKGAPVIFEDHPTFANLIGRVEHTPQLGALVTDFTLIKPGSLHRANGGYLLIDALKLVRDPLAWDALKRVIRRRKILIESPSEYLTLVSTTSLEPEPMPMALKIILFGDQRLYYLLAQADPEFEELFKVAADIDPVIDRTEESVLLYARLLGNLCRKMSLLPLDTSGAARAIERASRFADDREKLSSVMQPVQDLLTEADFIARQQEHAAITGEDIENAASQRLLRASRLQERSAEMITRGIVMIDTEGAKTGQINGLSVLSLGSVAFGRPNRITARVRMGTGHARVIDIEREVDLGGPLHSKGVLILSGFLQAQFLPDAPLSLAATLVFEQSYGGVDGDSASSAELYALLSALSGLPIHQGFAVTGSVNQAGQVQAIGGVNEKIEGFFDVCAAHGLTGRQGVLIPKANTAHLMLKHEVRQAVAEGKFAIYALSHIEEGIELLTGAVAGTRQEDGHFPPGSVFARVEERLMHFANAARQFARKDKE